jgi:hypothetical protein
VQEPALQPVLAQSAQELVDVEMRHLGLNRCTCSPQQAL